MTEKPVVVDIRGLSHEDQWKVIGELVGMYGALPVVRGVEALKWFMGIMTETGDSLGPHNAPKIGDGVISGARDLPHAQIKRLLDELVGDDGGTEQGEYAVDEDGDVKAQ